MDWATTKRWCVGMFAATSMMLSGTTPSVAHPVDMSGPTSIVKIKFGADRSELKRLAAAGYDIAGVDLKSGTADVVIRAQNESIGLRISGFNVVESVAVDQALAPDANYKTSAEVEQILRRFATDYPQLARMESIGKSGDNRDIWAIKITDNPDVRELDEPTILFNGMHHAREVMTPEVALDTVEYLLTRYGTDAQATRWVEANEIWIVPMLNVDGNNKVWTGSSMWRKNTRGGYGVDINRNYPYAWNTCNGSSGSTFSDSYRGPSAGSEPETQALMNLVARTQPVFNISYHSYSELVIYPYGCTGRRAETRDVIEPIGRQMAALLPSDSGSGTYDPGTAWELLYDVDGGDIDWMYNVHNVIPYVIEVNTTSAGFQPAYRLRQPTVEKLRAAWGLLLDKLDQSGVRGVVTDGAGRTQPGAMLTVENLTRGPGQLGDAPTISQVKVDGTYHVVLNPGTYRLTFTHNGRAATHDVTIGTQRVDLNVDL